ncbi:MAG: DUF928 domain-containing protein [Microcoleaceae cyanobacterium]
MVWKALSRYPTLIFLAGVTGMPSVGIFFAESALGQTARSTQLYRSQLVVPTQVSQAIDTDWNQFQPPTVGVPGRREGGGTRGSASCQTGASKLVALIPASTSGRTSLEQPTLLFYLPVAFDQVPADLEIADEEENVVYKTSLKISNRQPGVIKLDLADQPNAPTLEADRDYHWYLTLRCSADSPDASSNITVHGWINRVQLDSAQAQTLEQASPEEKLAIYSEKALWYDALATLAKLRASNPSDPTVESQWSELLEAVGLDRLVQEPIVTSQAVPEN